VTTRSAWIAIPPTEVEPSDGQPFLDCLDHRREAELVQADGVGRVRPRSATWPGSKCRRRRGRREARAASGSTGPSTLDRRAALVVGGGGEQRKRPDRHRRLGDLHDTHRLLKPRTWVKQLTATPKPTVDWRADRPRDGKGRAGALHDLAGLGKGTPAGCEWSVGCMRRSPARTVAAAVWSPGLATRVCGGEGEMTAPPAGPAVSRRRRPPATGAGCGSPPGGRRRPRGRRWRCRCRRPR